MISNLLSRVRPGYRMCCCAAIAVLSLTACSDTVVNEDFSDYSGSVFEAATLMPIESVRVTPYVNGAAARPRYSDSFGKFAIVIIGDVSKLQFTKTGYDSITVRLDTVTNTGEICVQLEPKWIN